jgi:hypothetical protein
VSRATLFERRLPQFDFVGGFAVVGSFARFGCAVLGSFVRFMLAFLRRKCFLQSRTPVGDRRCVQGRDVDTHKS